MSSLRPTLKYEKLALRRGAKYIAGADEVGRGPLAGPVVACALILKSTKFKNRIADSKILTERQRERAAKEIREKAVFSVAAKDHAAIDEINILQATIGAIEDAIEGLSVTPDTVFVDGRLKLNIGLPYRAIIGGDAKCLTIAAASIIAKVARDKMMAEYDNLYPQYGFIRNKGYGTPEHIRALRRYGPSPIHRLTFSPCATLLK